jgi:peptide/nickel transport system permease protein
VEVMLGETASSADKDELRRSLGLDQPVYVQYRAFVAGLVTGDLGRSLYEQGSVTALIAARLPSTVELALAALLVAALLSFPLALLAAARRGTWRDRGALLFSLLGLSIPNFWLGPLLIILFSIQLGWLPVSGSGGAAHLILPSITLGLGMAAILTRILRASLLRVRNEDYVQAARAKGVSEQQVWLKHMLRNALLPVITIMSLQFGSLLAGAVITETIFSWPGIGRLTVQAIQTRDYPLVQGCVLAIAVTYIFVNFLADILYRLADPRIIYEE